MDVDVGKVCFEIVLDTSWRRLCFLIWCIFMMRGSIRRWKATAEKGGTWSATTLRSAVAFKPWLISKKGPKVCQEMIPYTVLPPPPEWTVDTMQSGSMDSCWWHQILNITSAAPAEILIHQTRLWCGLLRLYTIQFMVWHSELFVFSPKL